MEKTKAKIPSEVCNNERMKLIAIKTNDGGMLHVSRQGFYKYLMNKDRPWNYQLLADVMMEIQAEDECNDTYGCIRMYQALLLKQPEHVSIPSERTVYRIMEEIRLSYRPKCKPNGITRADRET